MVISDDEAGVSRIRVEEDSQAEKRREESQTVDRDSALNCACARMPHSAQDTKETKETQMNGRDVIFTVTSLLLVSVEEHLYTSFLSSPASMRTFYSTDDDSRKQVLGDAKMALGLSAVATAFAAWGTRDARVLFVGMGAAGVFFYLLLRKGNIL